MKTNTPKPSLEDVLNAFAVEPNPDSETLARYLRDYPESAVNLNELSQELLQPVAEMTGPLSAEDKTLIDNAWKRYQKAVYPDPFGALAVSKLREIAKALGIPRNVLMAFRERKVVVASVPQPFLARLASALSTPMDRLTEFLKLPATQEAWSYKADAKPEETGPVPFEQLLIDAGVPESERAKLMSGE